MSLPRDSTQAIAIWASYPDHLCAKLLDPAIMVPPLRWLASARSDGVTGQRFIAARWREDSPETAAEAGW
jgi:hypothetical protein